jgi:hypothetical protein
MSRDGGFELSLISITSGAFFSDFSLFIFLEEDSGDFESVDFSFFETLF